MSKEELLKPRYKVENKWPGCAYEVDEILHQFNYGNGNKYFALGNGAMPFDEKEIKNFPYLLRPLSWWEDRKPEEMPEYLKINSTGDVFKCSDYVTGTYKNHLMNYQPSTEQEYNDYINSQPVKL